MPKIKPVSLDGSTLEGGGQLVRVALSLSAITATPVHIYNIRANRAPQGHSRLSGSGGQSVRGGRSKDTDRGSGNRSGKLDGGLKESHLAALEYLAWACNASVEGAEVGSREITFWPGTGCSLGDSKKTPKGSRRYNAETNTITLQNPGSVWLILQALLPFMVFSANSLDKIMMRQNSAANLSDTESNEPIELTLRGGTNVSKSMSGEYVQYVLLPTLERIGIPPVSVTIKERGWANNASHIGEVKIRLPRPPAGGYKLSAFDVVDRGKVERITVHMVMDSKDLHQKLQASLNAVIVEHFGEGIGIEVMPFEPSGDVRRLYILLVAHTSNGWKLGGDFLGTGRTPKNEAEQNKVLDQACQSVIRELRSSITRGGCVDEYLMDQLVIFQAIAAGESRIVGGDWKDDRKPDEEETGDDQGSLHTRTVRWVCEKMLQKHGVEFQPNGVCRGIEWNSSGDPGILS